MIERLSGVCVLKQTSGIVLDVGGVGYGVEMTPRSIASLADGQSLVLWTYTHVTQDALRLFGFPTTAERQMFALLLSASGLGPKIAMAILAHFEPFQLAGIIEREAAELLEDVPGIGARQSKKFILELKPKVTKLRASGSLAAAPSSEPIFALRAEGAAARSGLDEAMLRDLKSALENFGYKDKELAPLLRKYERKAPTQELQGLIRMALSELTGAARTADSTAKTSEELF